MPPLGFTMLFPVQSTAFLVPLSDVRASRTPCQSIPLLRARDLAAPLGSSSCYRCPLSWALQGLPCFAFSLFPREKVCGAAQTLLFCPTTCFQHQAQAWLVQGSIMAVRFLDVYEKLPKPQNHLSQSRVYTVGAKHEVPVAREAMWPRSPLVSEVCGALGTYW